VARSGMGGAVGVAAWIPKRATIGNPHAKTQPTFSRPASPPHSPPIRDSTPYHRMPPVSAQDRHRRSLEPSGRLTGSRWFWWGHAGNPRQIGGFSQPSGGQSRGCGSDPGRRRAGHAVSDNHVAPSAGLRAGQHAARDNLSSLKNPSGTTAVSPASIRQRSEQNRHKAYSRGFVGRKSASTTDRREVSGSVCRRRRMARGHAPDHFSRTAKTAPASALAHPVSRDMAGIPQRQELRRADPGPARR
jgi:hypothetical protein